MPYWAFVDWAAILAGGVKGSDGSAAIYDCNYFGRTSGQQKWSQKLVCTISR